MNDNNTTPAMKEVESIEQVAEMFFETDSTARCWPKKAVLHIFKSGAQYREENPVKPVDKEGISAEEIIRSFGLRSDDMYHVDTIVKAMHAYHAAQLTEVKGEENLLTDCQELLMNLIALNHVPDEVCPDMNDMISRIDDVLAAA